MPLDTSVVDGKYGELYVYPLVFPSRAAPSVATITVATGGAAQGAVSIPINALAAGVTVYKGTELKSAAGKLAFVSATAAPGATALTVDALDSAIAAADTFAYDRLVRVVGGTSVGYAENETTTSLTAPTFETRSGLTYANDTFTGAAPETTWAGHFKPSDPGFQIVQNAARAKTEVYARTVFPREDGTPAEEYKGAAKILGYAVTNPASGITTAPFRVKWQGQPIFTRLA